MTRFFADLAVGTGAPPAPSRGRPRDEHTDEAIVAATLRLLKDVGYGILLYWFRK